MNPAKNFFLLFLLISTIVIVAFFPSLFSNFTNFDDNWMLTDNYLVRSLNLSHIIKNIFGTVYNGVYQPLVFLSYAIEYYFFGLNPFVFHLDNLVLHVINTLLVYFFIYQLSSNKYPAVLACLFWSLNPLRVESVTWVAERKDLLYALFYLLSLINYVLYLKIPNKKVHLYFSFLFFILSCLSKLMAVSLGLVVILLDYFFLRKPDLKCLVEKGIFLGISLFTGLFSIWALKQENVVITTFIYSLGERSLLVSHSLIKYFVKCFIPFNLSVFHPYKYPPGHLPPYYILFLLLSLIGLSLFVWFSIKFKNRKIIFGILFFFFAMVFALQIFPVGEAAFADRNIYISSIGIAFLAGEFFTFLSKKYSYKIVAAFFCFVLFAYGIVTYRQTLIWHDNASLFSDVIKKYPDSHIGYLYRGIDKFLNNDLKGAGFDFDSALIKNPQNFSALLNRGLIKKNLNDYTGALADYNKVLNYYPEFGNAYVARGLLFYAMNKHREAELDFTKAIEVSKDKPFMVSVALISRGRSELAQNKIDSAIFDLNFSISIVPDNAEAWFEIGRCYFEKKEFYRAKENFEQAVKLDSRNGMAFYFSGMCEIFLSDTALACQKFQQSALLNSPEGNKKFLYYCGTRETREKLFYPNGKDKFRLSVELNSINDTTYFLCHFDSIGKITQKGSVDHHTQKYNGEVKWFYPDSTLEKTGFLNDTIPFGLWKEFYPKGAIREEYSFNNGLKDGSYKFYYPNGIMQTERFYNSGKLTNVFFCRDLKGNNLNFGNFAAGNGSLKIFNENGKFIHEELFINGISVKK